MTDSLLAKNWQQMLSNYSTLFVGFSGGLDSTVLLHCLAMNPKFANKLQAVHIHHGLSVNAPAWQDHCHQFCDALAIPLIICQVEVDGHANIEEGARIARYKAFTSLLNDNDGLLLAHHNDDQAETLLLQLFRGAGIDGMSAMAEIKKLSKGQLLRPFLKHSRQTLDDYAKRYKLTWVDDESNQNSAFSRNYLRHHVMPLLQQKWPGVVSNLARSVEHCQQAKLNLEALAALDYVGLGEKGDKLALSPLQTLGKARHINVLRVWFKNNHVRCPSSSILNRLIDDVILATDDATPIVQWGGMVVRRYQHTLYLLKNETIPRLDCLEWSMFPEPLKLGDLSLCLSATVSEKGLMIPAGLKVHVRFRQGGELFYWRGQNKQLKKLLQEWQIPPWQRAKIPLLYIDDKLAAVVGFAIGDHYYSEGLGNSYSIELTGSYAD